MRVGLLGLNVAPGFSPAHCGSQLLVILSEAKNLPSIEEEEGFFVAALLRMTH